MKNKNKKDNFVHLHTHSDMSQLDGCATINAYMEAAKDRGSPALAITDHGTMRGYHEAHVRGEQHGIKPIHGIEFYVAKNMNRKGITDDEKSVIGNGLDKTDKTRALKEFEQREGLRKRWHLTAWAKNDVGLKNLFKLSSLANTEGFYYKPRIDIETLIKYSEGLMVGTGCLASQINDAVVSGRKKQAYKIADELFDCFGEDLWLEIQPHRIKEQATANRFALKLLDRYEGKARLLATQDAHYVRQGDACHHDVMLCIGTHARLSDTNRFKFDGDYFFLKTRKQMFRTFMENHSFLNKNNIKNSLNNTMLFSEIADAKIKIDYLAAILPEVEIEKGFKSDWKYFKALCFRGWIWRDIERRAKRLASKKGVKLNTILKEYKERLSYEMNTIKNLNFIKYFLLVHEIYKWVREQRIMCGPGRGSAAGSLVSFLLGITSVDPLEHGLLFERFMNPDRIDLPDIDMDFEESRRQEIIDYLRDKYGDDHVAQIATVNTLKGRACIKDVSRVLSVPIAAANEVTSSIIDRPAGDKRANKTIIDSFAEFEVCKNFNEKYPDVLGHAAALEGLAKTIGIHAAGVVVTPKPITDYTPIELRKYKDKDRGIDKYITVTALDKEGVSAIGLVKLDVLGLKTLTVIRQCLEYVEERHGVWHDMESLDLDDQKVIDAFTERDFSGVFQFDTPGAEKLCEGIVFDSFEDMPTLNALNRPGATRSGLAKEWVSKKKNPKKRKKSKYHKTIVEITSDTLGIITYQEHVNKIFIEVSGFRPALADTLRKKIGKSKGKEAIDEIRDEFIEGAIKKHGDNGMTKEAAEKIINAIGFFGGYGFNKSHATSYAIIAYWCMWLKVYYPLEFYCSLLKNEEKTEKIQKFAKDSKKRGIKILNSDVSYSKKYFAIDPTLENTIRGSLLDIKNVGKKGAETISKNQPYSSFHDFITRIDRKGCNKRVIKALAQSGALNNLVPNLKWFLDNLDNFWNDVSNEEIMNRLFENSKNKPDYDKEERNLLASTVNPFSFGEHPIISYKKFLSKHIKVKTVAMGEGFFEKYNNKTAFVLGIIVDTKFARVGDFHTGDLPSDEERKLKFWGARYANVNLEDRDGERQRVKFDIDVFERVRNTIDSGSGTPVLVHINNVNASYKSMKADFVVNLEVLRKKLKQDEPLDMWEKLVTGKHPAFRYKWKSEKEKTLMTTHEKFKKSKIGGVFSGVITHVSLKYDKNKNQMAFIGIFGAKKHIEIVCFASTWAKYKNRFVEGKFVKIAVEKQRQIGRGLTYIYNGGGIKTLKGAE